MGNDTREKYEGYLRDEKYTDAFKDFFYYYNENDENDKNNTKTEKFINPHLNMNQMFINNINETNNDKENGNNLYKKFSRIKSVSTSCSTNTLMRHYRQSSNLSNNSTNSSMSHRILQKNTNY
jgi:hypothetical protein